MARRYYAFKGKAKTCVAIGVLLFAAWAFLGQSLFSFDLRYFHQGFQFSFFRAGQFVQQGIHWDQRDRSLGRILSTGGEVLEIDLDARLTRGTMVLYVWRWPGFLYDDPMVERFRYRLEPKTVFEADERLTVPLRDAGIYVLSVTGVWTTGDVDIDWRVRGSDIDTR